MACDKVYVSVKLVTVDHEAAIVIAYGDGDEKLFESTQRADARERVFKARAFKWLAHGIVHLLVLDDRVAISDHIERSLLAVLIDGGESFKTLNWLVASGDVESLLVHAWQHAELACDLHRDWLIDLRINAMPSGVLGASGTEDGIDFSNLM